MEKTPLWKKTWFIMLMLWIVPPIGIALVWTGKKDWKKTIKVILTVLFGFWALLWSLILIGATADTPTSPESETTVFQEAVTEPFTSKPESVTLPIENTTVEEIAGNTEPETAENHTTTKTATTKKETTAKPTTTKASTTKTSAVTKPVATTKKVTTTAKPTTTKAPTTAKPTTTKAPATQNTETNYILNNNTMKFHYPTCSSVKKIAPENKGTFKGNRQTLLNRGYEPCGNCHP